MFFNRKRKIEMGMPCVLDPLNKMHQDVGCPVFCTPISRMPGNKKMCICILDFTDEHGENYKEIRFVHESFLFPFYIDDASGTFGKYVVIRYPESMPKFGKEDLDLLNSLMISSELNHPVEYDKKDRLAMLYSKLKWYADTWDTIMKKDVNDTDV